MSVYVIRQDKYGRGERWTLAIGDFAVTLVQPDGEPLLEWTPEQAADGVQFPSFSKSIKYVGFNASHMGMFQFAMGRETVKALRAFANRGIAARGPEALRTVFYIAVLGCIFGTILLCVGTLLFVLGIYGTITGKFASSGTDHITFMVAITGFAILCRGIYGFYQYSQLRKLTNAQAGGAV